MPERKDLFEAVRQPLKAALLALVVSCLGGCQTAQYYHQAIRGEVQILRQRTPIAELLAEPSTKAMLRERFELVQRLRVFAENSLKLPVNKHYLTYVDLHRRFAIWNVHAAPEFSLEPRKWWYPFVGSLKYRGYFSEPEAREYANRLRRTGEDVHMEGVEAYSTLGWFADPLLNTFIHHSEPDLAEILFHELAHQRLFLSGDTDFNEAFATTVAEEGVRRWFAAAHDEAGYREYLIELERNQQFVALVMRARRELQSVYGERDEHSRIPPPSSTQAKTWIREAKTRIIARLREDYAKSKASWGGYSGYDGWFAQSLNNAQLNTVSVYYELVPGFQKVLQEEGGDLEAFYRAVRRLHKLGKEARHHRLIELGAGLSKARP